VTRFESGWIKWHRSAFYGDIGSNIHCLGLWIALLSMATLKETKIIWNGSQRVLPPGSILTGFRELADRLSCSRDTIGRWLDYLRHTDRVAVDHSTRGTLITVLNWNTYQSSSENVGHEADTDQTTAGHDTPPTVGRQPDLIEEYKKERRKNYSSVFDLEAAYQLYPQKCGTKGKGLKKLATTVKTEQDYADLLAGLKYYAQSKRVKDGYIKNFVTWAGEWRDWAAMAKEARTAAPGRLKTFEELDAEVRGHAS